MKIYLAARYSRNPEMREHRDALEAAGHVVTSRWIDQHGGELEESFTPERLDRDPDFCGRFALVDVEDLEGADMVVSFTGNGGGGKGGRHVEFGLAAALKKRLVLIGPRENVFHCLPQVMVVRDVAALIRLLQMSGYPGRTTSPSPAATPNCPLSTGLRPCECDMPRCPECGYTEHDAQFEMDHHVCPGTIPGTTSPSTTSESST